MTLSFANVVGNPFNVLGSQGGLLKQVRAYQTALRLDLINATNGLTAQLAANPDLQALVGGSYIQQLNSCADPLGALASQSAQQAINRAVFLDNPRINQTLTQLNVVGSIQEIIRQMKIAGATVQACTVTATPGSFATFTPPNVGNGSINISVRRPSDGRVQENSFAEMLQFLCTQDSYLGGASAGNEGFVITGEGAQTDPYAFDWPLGSNCRVNISAIDGNTDNGAGNILTNSGYNNWTGSGASSTLDDWSLVLGAYGTNITKETGTTYDGGACIALTGDGTINANLTQQFGSSSGTTGTLSPLTQYSWNQWFRRDGVAAANGTWTIDLIDGSNNVINDQGGTPNSFSISLTGLTTAFTAYTGIFRTPQIMPSTVKIRMRLTGTALTAGRTVYMDKGSLGQMTRLYLSGPSASVHSGSIPFASGDYCFSDIANNRGGAADGVSTFQTLSMRLLPMMQNNLMWPSSGTPTISDSLILMN